VENGKARQRPIVFGAEYEKQIEVLSGLDPGEVVVVKGADRLRDGSRVLALE
jgi:multidrug efflux pump subunit AcrA (membrane-fusion protein)